jgi:S1-C subfamily serine protease
MSRFPSGALALILTLALPAVTRANPDVFAFALPSTAWVISPVTDRQQAVGTGVVVSLDDRWVLTAYHVTGDRQGVVVVFPCADAQGDLITSPRYYQQNLARLGIRGRVVATDPAHDLALIQLERLPNGVRALPLAQVSPRVGEALHLIGNSGFGGETMWRYGMGKVRSVYERTWRSGELAFRSRVIENQIPGNAGDSGGPVINDRGELVGLHHGQTEGKNGLFYAIDIRPIRRFLAGRSPLVGGTWVCRFLDGTCRLKRYHTDGSFQFTEYDAAGRLAVTRKGEFVFVNGEVRLSYDSGPGHAAPIVWTSRDQITAGHKGALTTWHRR